MKILKIIFNKIKNIDKCRFWGGMGWAFFIGEVTRSAIAVILFSLWYWTKYRKYNDNIVYEKTQD